MLEIKNTIVKKIVILLCSVLFVFACQNNYWNEHFQAKSDENKDDLMTILSNIPELSEFCKVVKETGYNTLLASSQTYTVWAPDNQAMSGYIIDENAKQEFLNNHIARFIHNTTDVGISPNLRVQMLNGKYLVFDKTDGNYTFGGAKMETPSHPASNGLLHIINSRIPFRENIWETLRNSNSTDSIARYLTSLDQIVFQQENSTPIGTNEFGQTVYDSVFFNYNTWQMKYGYLQMEDSIYTMLLPTNTAWIDAKTRILPYYKTFGNMLTETGTGVNVTRTFETSGFLADSLQESYSLQNLTKDLVFSDIWDVIPTDSLVSTSGNVFYNPGYIFENTIKTNASNGLVYITNELMYSPVSSWHKPIVVEAEYPPGRLFDYATINQRSTLETQYKDSVSGYYFLEARNTSTSSITQPYVSFEIPNTLAAKYNIYCVFAPPRAFDPAAALDSTKVQFLLTYIHADGTMKEDAAISKNPETGLDFITNSDCMTKFPVAKNFVFPYANVSSNQIVTVRLRVRTNVANNETLVFTKRMRIDCLILEPVNE